MRSAINNNPMNKKKYEQVILYLCARSGGEIRGKKKLAKLLYYADFDFFEKFQKSITGDVYKAYPKGPLPENLGEIADSLAKKGLIRQEAVQQWGADYAPTEVYKSLVEPDISLLSKDEIKMLDRVIRKYGALNGEQLAELTHAEAPYAAVEQYKEIPYEFSFYRGTDFSDL